MTFTWRDSFLAWNLSPSRILATRQFSENTFIPWPCVRSSPLVVANVALRKITTLSCCTFECNFVKDSDNKTIFRETFKPLYDITLSCCTGESRILVTGQRGLKKKNEQMLRKLNCFMCEGVSRLSSLKRGGSAPNKINIFLSSALWTFFLFL